MPDSIDFYEAVACTEGAHYAINFLRMVDLNPDDRVLINGATLTANGQSKRK